MTLPRATAKIQEHNGAPTLFINGIAHPGFGCIFREGACAGAELVGFAARLDFGPGPADFGRFDRQMEAIHNASPAARVLPRIAVDWPSLEGAEALTSFASKAWLADAGIALQGLLRHAEERYGDRIIGYRLDAGDDGQWLAAEERGMSIDRSRPAQAAFRDWLATRQFPLSELDAIPDERMLRAAEYGIFREPANMEAGTVIEYWRFLNDTVFSAISQFARLARDVVGPEKLLGACYGFAGRQHESGHLAMRRFLDDPNINFGCGPEIPGSVAASFAARGKLWWAESTGGAARAGRREFGAALCRGGAVWSAGETAGPDAERMRAIANRSLLSDRSPVAEVCVVLDDDSICYTQFGNKLTSLVEAQLAELSLSGVPFSAIHGEDLARARKHRFYIFLNHFALSAQRARNIEEVSQSGDVTVLYVYAVGLIGQAVAPTRMMRVLGMSPIELSPYPAMLRVQTTGEHGEMLEYGLDDPIAPVISCEDGRAEVLGRLVANDRPGLARKRTGRATAIYSSAPRLPASLLRRLFREAGVHLYAEAGVRVWASQSMITVAGQPGEGAALSMPRGEKLYDVFDGIELQMTAGFAELPASEDGTRVLFRGSQAEWERGRSDG